MGSVAGLPAPGLDTTASQVAGRFQKLFSVLKDADNVVVEVSCRVDENQCSMEEEANIGHYTISRLGRGLNAVENPWAKCELNITEDAKEFFDVL